MLQSPTFWRLIALAIFILIMAAIAIGARWFFESIPLMATVAIVFSGGGLSAGYLLGLRDGRKQALHPGASPE